MSIKPGLSPNWFQKVLITFSHVPADLEKVSSLTPLIAPFPDGRNSSPGFTSILPRRVGTLELRIRFSGLILQEEHLKRSPIS